MIIWQLYNIEILKAAHRLATGRVGKTFPPPNQKSMCSSGVKNLNLSPENVGATTILWHSHYFLLAFIIYLFLWIF